MGVGYFRSWYGNVAVTQNTAVSAADHDPFCVTVPSDPRLPGGGGNQVCGFYDVKPSKFGQVNNVITKGSRFGKFSDVYNGVEATFNMRFGKGAMLAGGVSTAQTVINLCGAATNPNLVFPTQIISPFCETTHPWKQQTQIKINGAYPLPWGFNASAVVQNLPGASIGTAGVGQSSAYSQIPSTLAFTNAQIALARPQSVGVSCGRHVHGRARLEGDFDVYDLFNSAAVLPANATFGPAFKRPNQILAARLFKVGGKIEF